MTQTGARIAFIPGVSILGDTVIAMPDRTTAAIWPTSRGTLALHLAAVAGPERFSPDWFIQHAIDHPPHIARSVLKRQAEYFAGRLCARDSIAAHGIRPMPVGSTTMSAPVWPAGLLGSISHSKLMAMATVVPNEQCRGIGIDLELVPGQEGLNALRAVALNERERALVASSPGQGEEILTTMIFSAKESFFKATAASVGFHFDFTAIECVDISDNMLTCLVREPLGAELQPGMRFSFDTALWDGHVLTSFRW